MSLQHTEVELTFELKNRDELASRLDEIAMAEKREEYQKDTYYSPVHRNFLAAHPISEWLRIRESDKGGSINYKDWHNLNDPKAVSCDEYETTVTDADALKEILRRLNFRELVVVEKRRSTWKYKDVEIALDQVTDLGDSIELEAKGDFESIAAAKTHLETIAGELDAELGPQDFKGYPHRLLERHGAL